MERLHDSLARTGSNLNTDKSLRLGSRPLSKASGSGRTFENLGSSFTKRPPSSNSAVRETGRSSKLKVKPTLAGSILDRDLFDSDDEDELNLSTPQHCRTSSDATSRKVVAGESGEAFERISNRGVIVINGKPHALHPDFPNNAPFKYSNLKFKKKKTVTTELELSSVPNDHIPTFSASSISSLSRDNSKSSNAISNTPHTSIRARGSAIDLKPSGSSVTDKSSNLSCISSTSEICSATSTPRKSPRPRPRPRPLGSNSSSKALLGPSKVPADPSSRSTRASKPIPNKIMRRKDETTYRNEEYSRVKAQAAAFPLGSPLSSPVTRAKTLPLSSPIGGGRKSDTKSTVEDFPMGALSPLSSQPQREADKGGENMENPGSDSDREYNKESRRTLRPFPMNTQVLGSKRLSEKEEGESCDERERKRRKETEDLVLSPLARHDTENDIDNDEDSLFISPHIDPRTLCPYCDTILPTFPTPLLTRLLAAAAKKSYRDPRPSNPLGRKAPFTTFIGVCQRHRFESLTLPEGENRGWPKVIEWKEIRGRVTRFKKELEEIIADDTWQEKKENRHEVDEKNPNSAKAKCVFWREVMKEVKKKGSRAVAGVGGQFASFEKTQPGYYGELGSVIIHQTLYDLFPPASFDHALIFPLTPAEFIQRILVPEVAVRLIMQDQALEGDLGMESAVKTLRESASYGVAMFPEDGGEWNDDGSGSRRSTGHGEEMGVADIIVMERAKKRRKELEEEEREETEIWERQEEVGVQNQKGQARKDQGKGRGKGKKTDGNKIRQMANEVSETEPPTPRLKPKASVRIRGREGSEVDSRSEIESEGPKRGRNLELSPHQSPATSDSEASTTGNRSKRGRLTRAAKTKAKSLIQNDAELDIDRYGSSTSVGSTVSREAPKRTQMKPSVKVKTNKAKEDDEDPSGTEITEPLRTPRNPRRLSIDEITPRAPLSNLFHNEDANASSFTAGNSAFIPLLAAQNPQNRTRLKTREKNHELQRLNTIGPIKIPDEAANVEHPTSSPEPPTHIKRRKTKDDYNWLLSDESQSSD